MRPFPKEGGENYKWVIDHTLQSQRNTVKTLYNVTRCNRIFNIRHKIAGNGSVSIKIPSL